jgi:hypothetical protein
MRDMSSQLTGADRDIDERDEAAEHHRQHDHEKDEGDRIQDIDDSHHKSVDPAADEAGSGAPDDADDQADEGGGKADQQRHLAAIERAHEQVTVVGIGAQEIAGGESPVCSSSDVPVDVIGRAQAEIGRQKQARTMRRRRSG